MTHAFARRLALIDPVARSGRVTKIMPTHIEADGPNLPLGALCTIEIGRLAGDGGGGAGRPQRNLAGSVRGCAAHLRRSAGARP